MCRRLLVCGSFRCLEWQRVRAGEVSGRSGGTGLNEVGILFSYSYSYHL